MTDEEWQKVLDAQPERAKALRALAVPGDPVATALAQLAHLLDRDAAKVAVALAEAARRYDLPGWSGQWSAALRSVVADVHADRWVP